MRIPKNIIKTNKYTAGGELIYKETQTPYQGYYYIFNNKYFVGKEYKPDAPELIKNEQANTLLNRPSTSLFSTISGITSQLLKKPKVNSIQSNVENNPNSTRYFSQQINIKPITIKEISKETYDSLQNNSLFITTFIGPTQSISQADQQMPGLKTWLLG